MTTASDLITRSLKTAGIVGSGESATSDQLDDGLVYLNDLLEALSLERLMVYAETSETFAPTGATSYTWGSGGTISTTRPLRLESAYFTLSGTDYDVDVITAEEYDRIVDKDATGDIVEYVYLDMTYPTATLYTYPAVNGGTLNLSSWKQLTSLSGLSTSISLPPGYERMLRYNLAVEMMPEYGLSNPDVAAMALSSKAAIKGVNITDSIIDIQVPFGRNRIGNILQGD